MAQNNETLGLVVRNLEEKTLRIRITIRLDIRLSVVASVGYGVDQEDSLPLLFVEFRRMVDQRLSERRLDSHQQMGSSQISSEIFRHAVPRSSFPATHLSDPDENRQEFSSLRLESARLRRKTNRSFS